MAALFDQTTINNMTLNNRLVRSATWEGMCDPNGCPTNQLTNCYKDLAEGGVGLIISGYTFVRPDGKQLPGKMGIHTDDFAASMQEMTKAVQEGGSKICIQLVHAGGQTTTETAGRQPLAPSAVKVAQFPEVPVELTQDDINDLVKAFADGARRAKAWGFDAIQLHAAHGYLINQFLSPLTNRRSDEYGGSLENRARFLMEVYRAVRSEVGSDYPVLVKLNGSDNLEGGLSAADALAAAKLLASEGIDSIEVSGGTSASGKEGPIRVKIDKPELEGFNLDLAKEIKQAVNCPVMSVGGFRSLEVINAALGAGMDYVAFSRPFIREPNLAKRWQEGDTSPATCISCNGCFKPGLKGEGIYCIVDKAEKEK